MSGDQAGELQGLPLPDGVHPLSVAFLLHVTGMARVHDTNSRGRCGEDEGKSE